MSEEHAELGTGGTPIAGAAGSLALRDIPIPDYCDVVIVPTGGVEESDPRVWAEAIFAHENTPLGSRGLRALRMAVEYDPRMIGQTPSTKGTLSEESVQEEAEAASEE